MKKFTFLALALLIAVGAQAKTAFFNDLSVLTPGETVVLSNQLEWDLTGVLPEGVELQLENNIVISLNDVTIPGSSDNQHNWAGITCLGNAKITLHGTNVVKGCGNAYAGIYVPFGSTLTIDGDGSLEVFSPGTGAGIGANQGTGCGNITINGGIIDAKGGIGAAAIGGVTDYGCGEIRINGGTIYAMSYFGGAAIGGGYNGYNGNIIIANTVYKLTAELDTYSVQLGSSVIGLGGGANASSYTVTVGGVDYGTIGVTTNPFVYNPGEQAISSSKAQLLSMINEANTIVNYIEAEDDFDETKAETLLFQLNSAIERSLTVYNNADAALYEVGNAMTDIRAVAYEAMEAVFEEEKRLFFVSIELLLEDGDSEACRQIVADAETDITTNVVYDSQMTEGSDLSVEANLTALDNALSYDAFMTVKEALKSQREAEKQGIDEVQRDKVQSTKVLRDGAMYIIRDTKTYTAQGAEVK